MASRVYRTVQASTLEQGRPKSAHSLWGWNVQLEAAAWVGNLDAHCYAGLAFGDIIGLLCSIKEVE